MAHSLKLCGLRELPRLPASAIDRSGWRAIANTVGDQGKAVVTRDDEAVAVVFPVAEYESIRQALQQADRAREAMLAALRHRFDERLGSLQAPDAGDRLRALMRSPARLGGKVRAGAHD